MSDIVIVAPHMDDEVLGCGGLMARNAASENPKSIHVVFLTASTSEYRSSEGAKVLDSVGASYSCQFCTDGSLSTAIPSAAQHLSIFLDTLGPTEVYIPCVSLHQDHEAANRIALIACRRNKATIYEYEYPELFQNFYQFVPNAYRVLTDEMMDRKVELMQMYGSQLTTCRDDSALRTLAQMRGYQIGESYAEAYRLIRGQVN